MSKEIQFRSDMTVKLVQHCGTDSTIVAAAKASTEGIASVERLEQEAKTGLIRFLVRQKHGVPFEHTLLTFTVHAPIFVFRELVKHRIGVSMSECSARYTEVEPVFWVPNDGRPMIPVDGYKAARPTFDTGTPYQIVTTTNTMFDVCREAWNRYQYLVNRVGIAKEVARSVLPVGTYSFAYVTFNARSLMAFLSLRTHDNKANHVSYPQAEIEDVANQMESEFAHLFPVTHAAFCEYGRECP